MQKNDIRILVVDDEADWRRTNQKILEKAGYAVDTAADAAEAIEKVKAGDYQLAVLDINLPDMNGDELVEQIKALEPDMHVIMLTGFVTSEHAGRARAHGSVDVLEKIGNNTADEGLADDLVLRVDELFAG